MTVSQDIVGIALMQGLEFDTDHPVGDIVNESTGERIDYNFCRK